MTGTKKILMWAVLAIVLLFVADWIYRQSNKDKKDDGSTKKRSRYDLGGAASNCQALSEVDFNFKRDVIYDRVWWGNGYTESDKLKIIDEFYRDGDVGYTNAYGRFAYDKMLLDGYCRHDINQ